MNLDNAPQSKLVKDWLWLYACWLNNFAPRLVIRGAVEFGMSANSLPDPRMQNLFATVVDDSWVRHQRTGPDFQQRNGSSNRRVRGYESRANKDRRKDLRTLCMSEINLQVVAQRLSSLMHRFIHLNMLISRPTSKSFRCWKIIQIEQGYRVLFSMHRSCIIN